MIVISTLDEVLEAIHKLKNNDASRLDNIAEELFKVNYNYLKFQNFKGKAPSFN